VRAGAGGGGLWREREREREREDGDVSVRLSFRVWTSMRLTCSKLAFMDVKTLVKVPVIHPTATWMKCDQID
jgi:hypothetical protein